MGIFKDLDVAIQDISSSNEEYERIKSEILDYTSHKLSFSRLSQKSQIVWKNFVEMWKKGE